MLCTSFWFKNEKVEVICQVLLGFYLLIYSSLLLETDFDSGELILATSGTEDIIEGKAMVVTVTGLLHHRIRIQACMLQLLFPVLLKKGCMTIINGL